MQSLKLVVIGDGTVGKTSLLLAFTQEVFVSEYVPTVFDNFCTHVMFQGQPINLVLFDTAGQEDYERLRPLSYEDANVMLILFSVVSETSFQNVHQKWISEARKYCPTLPILLVGTKTDLRNEKIHEEKVSSFEEGVELADKIGAFRYVECSAATQEGVKRVFDEAILSCLKPSKRKTTKSHSQKSSSKAENHSTCVIM